MTDLGNRNGQGFLDPLNPYGAGFWTVKFDPKDLPADRCEIWHIALQGPGGYFYVYLDTAFYSANPRGDVNEYDPKQAIPLRPGQEVYFYWRNAIPPSTPPAKTVLAPSVWIYLRTPQTIFG